MSSRNLVIILISSFLIFASVPVVPAASQTGGWTKDQVRQVQMALKDQGCNPGAIDGVMGKMTMSAIRNFQMNNGFSATGRPDEQTRNALGIQTSSFRQKPSDTDAIQDEYYQQDKAIEKRISELVQNRRNSATHDQSRSCGSGSAGGQR
jgi:peptidoglycan hydrolase-like protein with peptidoglycan-binding domain